MFTCIGRGTYTRGSRKYVTRTTRGSFLDELKFVEPRRNDFVWMNLGQRIYAALCMAARNNGLTTKQARHFCMTPWVTDNTSRIFAACVDTWINTDVEYGLSSTIDDFSNREILESIDDMDQYDLYEKVARKADVWIDMRHTLWSTRDTSWKFLQPAAPRSLVPP